MRPPQRAARLSSTILDEGSAIKEVELMEIRPQLDLFGRINKPSRARTAGRCPRAASQMRPPPEPERRHVRQHKARCWQ
jgi:hypothetical protein